MSVNPLRQKEETRGLRETRAVKEPKKHKRRANDKFAPPADSDQTKNIVEATSFFLMEKSASKRAFDFFCHNFDPRSFLPCFLVQSFIYQFFQVPGRPTFEIMTFFPDPRSGIQIPSYPNTMPSAFCRQDQQESRKVSLLPKINHLPYHFHHQKNQCSIFLEDFYQKKMLDNIFEFFFLRCHHNSFWPNKSWF